ncbi:OmpA family protein [Spirosoma aureum]|uniref:OmpA family protein n=1 Tax=Spirosoma aureum TaxID=2692134 RepID=A0A6G9AVQ7_9BACT|nr:OmpA family protein [Spirosoma aureum]QIP16375.1 OmpA family protein [Spirosoma aureum]
MRALLILFVYLAIATVGYSQQQKTPVKQQKTLFTISAIDGKTLEEIPARFKIHAKRANRKFDGQSQLGQPYAFVLTGTDTLTVITKTQTPGYYESEEVMVISCDTCPNYGYAVRLEKEDPKADSIFRGLQVNQTFRLDNVYFDQSSYVLRSESYPQLNKLVKTLITTPRLVIEIAGHTDNVGDRRLNVLLSENRAKVIRSYLARKGIAESRLRANGYGDTRPAAPNNSEENKRQNRRVEFVVLAL